MAILALWEGAYRVIHGLSPRTWQPWNFPAPSHVLDALLALLKIHTDFGNPISTPGWPIEHMEGPSPSGGVAHAIVTSPLIIANVASLSRLAAGFILSISFGGLIGLAMWRWKGFDQFLGPPLLGVQTLPSVCWVPIAILVLGLNERSILFVMVMGSFAAVAISLRDGLRVIPPLFPRAGLMLGARGWRLYRYVLLPASLPALASSLRQGFSFAWRSLMGAELILQITPFGLGSLLQQGRDFSDVGEVVAIMMVMVFIGMLADRWIFAQIQARIQARFGLT